MNGISRRSAFLLACAMALSAATAPAVAAGPQMVSADARALNMRSGPGTRYGAVWTVDKGYPFKVLSRKGNWLQVSDFENDKGWVYRSLTGRTAHHVVKAKVANLRRAPSTRSPIVAKLGYGEVLRTLGRQGDWVKVRREGSTVGWVAKRLVWGW